MRLVALLVAALLGAGVAQGRPARGRALVLLDYRGSWLPDEKTRVADAVAKGLDEAGLERVPEQGDAFSVDARFQPCIDREACRFEYGNAVGAYYVFALLAVKEAKSARVAVTLYNVGLLAESTVAVKRGRGLPGALYAARKVIGEAVDKEKRMARGTLELSSAPPGDAAFVDGHAAGTTNLTQLLYAGAHVVRVERKGLPPHIAVVNILPDKTLRHEARFEKTAVPQY